MKLVQDLPGMRAGVVIGRTSIEAPGVLIQAGREQFARVDAEFRIIGVFSGPIQAQLCAADFVWASVEITTKRCSLRQRRLIWRAIMPLWATK